MDLARRYVPGMPDDDEPARARVRSDVLPGIEGLEKVLRFSMPGRQSEPEVARDKLSGFSARDIAVAMDLVHQAAQSIRLAEDRAREGEARTQALLHRATEELRNAEARLLAAETRARAAEIRAEDSDTRAREAENWLRQIFATISEELPGSR